MLLLFLTLTFVVAFAGYAPTLENLVIPRLPHHLPFQKGVLDFISLHFSVLTIGSTLFKRVRNRIKTIESAGVLYSSVVYAIYFENLFQQKHAPTSCFVCNDHYLNTGKS
jgi:hypothetical protein